MSIFLTGLSGFVTTLAIAGGFIYFTEARPVPAWKVSKGPSWMVESAAASAVPIERVPASPARPSAKTSAAMTHTWVPPVDMMTTGAIPDQKSETAPEPEPSDATTIAHVQWCSERYLSYQPEDNSYRSYGGTQRECVSPFSDASNTRKDDPLGSGPTVNGTRVENAVVEEKPAAYVSSRHIASCVARYRSYRPEDNSYQPYGGGSRRQCE